MFAGGFEEFAAYIRKHYSGRRYEYLNGLVEADKKEQNFYASTYIDADNNMYVIYVPTLEETADNANVIVHELGHVAFGLLDTVGIKVNIHNDEPFTYLQGYLAGEVVKHSGWKDV